MYVCVCIFIYTHTLTHTDVNVHVDMYVCVFYRAFGDDEADIFYNRADIFHRRYILFVILTLVTTPTHAALSSIPRNLLFS